MKHRVVGSGVPAWSKARQAYTKLCTCGHLATGSSMTSTNEAMFDHMQEEHR